VHGTVLTVSLKDGTASVWSAAPQLTGAGDEVLAALNGPNAVVRIAADGTVARLRGRISE
jgi:hypothetical protein